MKNYTKFTGKYLCWSLFLMNIQDLKPAPLLKSDYSKDVFLWLCKVFKNTYFVEYLQTAASKPVIYQVYILFSEVRSKEEEEYKNYLRITSECFDELFVFVKDDTTKYITNVRDASTPKLKLSIKIFHIHSIFPFYVAIKNFDWMFSIQLIWRIR